MKIDLSQNISDILFKVLHDKESLSFDYGQIKNITTLSSVNNQFRIFTWGIQLGDGNYIYYGLSQVKTKDDEIVVNKFIDSSESFSDAQLANIQMNQWYGCIYYEMIQIGGKKSNLYALAGWDGADLFINRKILEQVVVQEDGSIKFGGKFKNNKSRIVNRLVFEYTERAVMSLNYNKKLKMFVADHLSAPAQFKGNPKYMGPDMSFDGYYFDDGKWLYLSDIDYKNQSKF
ncbi:MAG: hypothetical protein MJ211_02285 [Bacteroidales bacterium]|nr:hypothetical protein [Bacteroidales bacterium]